MNEHAKFYCGEFIQSSSSPQFALFINGEWGVGKTHFIKSVIDGYKESESGIKSSDIAYLSLFGVSSIDEIDVKMFEALHPILSSKGMQFASSFIRTALKIGVNVDFNGDGNRDGSIETSGSFSSNKSIGANNIKKKLLIVDDIERSFLKLNQVFGYFSSIVSQSDCKVIFIGNESKVTDCGVNEIKEKVIGLEFTIEPDIEGSVESFAKEIKININSEMLVNNVVIDVSRSVKCNNLRIIRQAMFNASILLKAISSFVSDEHQLIIFKIFLALYMQKSTGCIKSANDINDAIVAFLKDNVSLNSFCSTEKDKPDMYYRGYIPIRQCWNSIIFEGNYNNNYIHNVYNKENEESSTPEIKSIFLMLNSWYSLSKSQFLELLEKIDHDFESGNYLHAGEILHYFCIMSHFIDLGLLPKNQEELKAKVLNIIDGIKDEILPQEDLYYDFRAYGGWMFADCSGDVACVKEALSQRAKENYNISIAQEIEYDIEHLELGLKLQEFCVNIRRVNSSHKYYNVPLLKLVNIDSFYNKINSLDNISQMQIIDALTDRYGKPYENGKVEEQQMAEYENLLALRNKYEQAIGSVLHDPKMLARKNVLAKLNELITYFKDSCGYLLE